MTKTDSFLEKFGADRIFSRTDIDGFFGYDASSILKSLKAKGTIVPIMKGWFFIKKYGETGHMPVRPNFFVPFITKGKGFVSHGTALEYHGFNEQFFCSNVVTADNLTVSKLKVAGFEYKITKNAIKSDIGVYGIFDGETSVPMTDVERTLLDCFSRPDLCGGDNQIIKAFYEAVDEDAVNFKTLLKYLRLYPNKIKLAKTIGFLSDEFGMSIPENEYAELIELANSAGYVWFHRHRIGKGAYDKKWKIVFSPYDNFKSMITY